MKELTKKLRTIAKNEIQLEQVINELLAKSISRTDISVQGDADQIKQKFDISYIDPTVLQKTNSPPTREVYLNDDFGWVIGFSFAIPLIICLVTGIFLIGDIRSLEDNFLYGAIGLVTGSIIGGFLAWTVKKKHTRKLRKQEKKGGFAIWLVTHNPEQYYEAVKILKKYRLSFSEVK